MFVCHCAAITDGEITEAVDCGATTVTAISFETGAGGGCGGCHETIEAIIAARCGSCPRQRALAVA